MRRLCWARCVSFRLCHPRSSLRSCWCLTHMQIAQASSAYTSAALPPQLAGNCVHACSLPSAGDQRARGEQVAELHLPLHTHGTGKRSGAGQGPGLLWLAACRCCRWPHVLPLVHTRRLGLQSMAARNLSPAEPTGLRRGMGGSVRRPSAGGPQVGGKGVLPGPLRTRPWQQPCCCGGCAVGPATWRGEIMHMPPIPSMLSLPGAS